MKKRLISALFVFLSTSAWATGQMGESVEFEGRTYSTQGFPYLDAKIPHGRSGCTALWRGYFGSWLVIDKQLYLKQVVTDNLLAQQDDRFEKLEKPDNNCAGDYQVNLEKIYGRKAPIPATWFTGSIDLPDGKQLEYVHMGFASTYERNILLRFENGRLLGKIVLDNTQAFKKCGSSFKQFDQFYEANEKKPLKQQIDPNTWKPSTECLPQVISNENYPS